ncbi:MAG: hypothetical protein NTY99_00805 [DPANN group archaeon]|nr:hypothetical protein [DPANN group archaeon]
MRMHKRDLGVDKTRPSQLINLKPDKESEQFILDNFKKQFDMPAPKNQVLFAYSEDAVFKSVDCEYVRGPVHFVSCTKVGIELYTYKGGVNWFPITFSKKDNVDCIFQVLNYIQKSCPGKLKLASWVIKYALEKYDANCPLQLDNILQQGDHESLFAGKDACKRLEKLVKGGEE